MLPEKFADVVEAHERHYGRRGERRSLFSDQPLPPPASNKRSTKIIIGRSLSGAYYIRVIPFKK